MRAASCTAAAEASGCNEVMLCAAEHVTRYTSHVTRHTSHVILHTLHVTHHTSHVTGSAARVSQCSIDGCRGAGVEVVDKARAKVMTCDA